MLGQRNPEMGHIFHSHRSRYNIRGPLECPDSTGQYFNVLLLNGGRKCSPRDQPNSDWAE